MPTPVAKAKADAECPDGNEKLPGMLTGSGRSFLRLAGRSRRASYFTGRFTSVDVIAIDTMPRSAARRPARPPSMLITPAIANQSIDRLALLLSCLRERSASCRSFRVRRSNSQRSKSLRSVRGRSTKLQTTWQPRLAANPNSAVGPNHPAAPARRWCAARRVLRRWRRLVELGNLTCTNWLDRRAGSEKLADRQEMGSALRELRDAEQQLLAGRRRTGATVQMHDHDRPWFDLREHRRGDLLRIGVKGVDRVDVPLDRNEPSGMDQVERLPVVAAAGKPEILR